MMKMKKLLPVLIALMMVVTMAVPAQAKNEAVDVEVKSGSTEAKVAFTIEKVLALEGTVSTNEKTGFKVETIDMTYSKYDGSDPPITEVRSEDGKVVFIGANTPTDLKLTVVLKSTSPMQDGIYDVVLDFGRTTTSGSYNSSRLIAKIYVGVAKPSDDDSKGGDSESDTDKTETTTTTIVEEPEAIPPAVLEEVESEGSDRVGMLGMLETYELRSALEEAEKLKEAGGLTAAELSMLQEAINAGEEAMQGDRQSVIDEAAYNLFMVIEELGGPVEDREEEETPKREGGGVPLAIILAIAAALLAIAAAVAVYMLKKKKKTSYDGAPIVNYHIGDDDEA